MLKLHTTGTPSVEEPTIIKGGIAVDDRGIVKFCNDFTFDGVTRFYTLENHQVGYVRAWHGHKQEVKYCTVLKGSALICCVPLMDFDEQHDLTTMGYDDTKVAPDIYRFVLSEHKPEVLRIPGGYCNGFMALTEDALIVHFSTFTMEQQHDDDVRYPASVFQQAWEIEQR